jgi:hypothetical protein
MSCSSCKYYEDWVFVLGYCNYLKVEIVCPCCESCDYYKSKYEKDEN